LQVPDSTSQGQQNASIEYGIGCTYQTPECAQGYDCIDNRCAPKSGCEYQNPPCGESYNCVANACVAKQGCLYSNPQCDEEHVCIENECVTKFLTDISGAEFLILAPREFIEPASAIAKKREAEGIETVIKDVSDFGDQYEIVAWLDDYRSSHPRLEYVLLFGDQAFIPAFYSENPIRTLETPTDLPYALPQSDLPTLFVGRIPVQNPDEANRWLEKLNYYESYRGPTDVFLFGYSAEYDAYAEAHGDRISDEGYRVKMLNSADALSIASQINSGSKFSIFYGHGSAFSLHPVFTIGDIGYLDNKIKPTILFSGGCDTVNYASSQRSISEEMVVGENGAVAAIGATRNGGYGFDYEFVPAFFENCRNKRLGEAFVSALIDNYELTVSQEVWNSQDDKYEFARYFVERMTLLGDPTTKVCN